MLKTAVILICTLGIWALWGCRGHRSHQPPYHIVRNMDYQEKWRAFGENRFYTDTRNMRPLPEGTVARGYQHAVGPYFTGKADTLFVANPRKITMQLLNRGRERYDIFCSVCHGQAGIGNGIVVQLGFTPAPAYSDERILNLKDGEMFDVISNGVRTMPSLGAQVPPDDRWAVVAYVRALQRSMTAQLNDVPEERRGELDTATTEEKPEE